MAVFPSFKLTEKGEELLNRSIGEGKTLTFTKFELGDGNTPSDFRKQTGLVNKFYEFPILNTSIQKDQVLRIRGYFDNKSFSQDKQLKEIGVFVKIEGNETQYLYSYTNAGDTGDIIPANSRGFYSRTLDVANYIGYATNITFNIEQLRDRYAFNTENEMKVASYLKVGDKVELWGNLVLGDKPTDEYIIQESGEIELSNGLFAKKVSFKYIAKTIEEMQKLALKVGDIVEVLGYYTAGDGAGHKRIIAQEDDGSGILLNNGLYANIIHNGEILLTWFGAKADITYNSTNEVKKFFGYMKTNPYCNFIIPYGIFAWETNVFIPSNITLIINGKFVAFSNKGIRIESYDGITSTPAYTGTHDIVITGNGVVDARGNDFPDNMQTPFRIHHSKNVTIENITIKNISTYHAIESGGTDGLTVRNVKFKGEFVNPIYQVPKLNLEPIQIEQVTQDGASGAIPYDNTPTKNVIIEDCYFGASEEGGEMYACIGEHKNSSSLTFENIIIRNNIFDGINAQVTNTKGVICTSSNYKNLVISGNQFKNCKGICINQRDNTINDGEISNNVIINNISDDQLKTMRFVNVNNLLIANNIVSNATDSFFWIFGVSNQLKVINNLCDNICNYNDINQDTVRVGLALYGSGNGVIIKNNTFSSKSNYFNKPIHIPTTQLSKYTNLNIDNNTFIMNKFDIDNYNRYMEKNEDVLFEGNAYYDTINFTNPINWYNEIDIIYSIQDSILSKRIKISHIADINANIKNRDIIIRDFNLLDTTGEWTMFEYSLYINSDYLSGNIRINIRNSNGTYSSKKDNVEDRQFIKIVKIVGYGRNNRVMINPLQDRIRTIISLKPQMIQDGVINDYNSYITELNTYEDSQKKELEDRWKAYEQALTTNPNLTYEEFIASYPMMLTNIEEPTIPKSVQDFMKKYL